MASGTLPRAPPALEADSQSSAASSSRPYYFRGFVFFASPAAAFRPQLWWLPGLSLSCLLGASACLRG